jgi:hypothetical protein
MDATRINSVLGRIGANLFYHSTNIRFVFGDVAPEIHVVHAEGDDDQVWRMFADLPVIGLAQAIA